MTATTTKPRTTRCSFCGKPHTEIQKLVAGPGVFICNQCVALAAQVIEQSNAADAAAAAPKAADDAEAAEQAPRPVAPWEADMPLETVLDVLPKIATTAAQTEENLRMFVGKARDLGATWTQVGAALGIARQSAWERFSGEE
jgi:hypothetical protein